MKTKIIYISGGELFEMTQVRAAFDEVRKTLGLDKDTVLFGVPVDCDSALDNAVNTDNDVMTDTEIKPQITTNTEINTPTVEPIIEMEIESEPEIDIVSEPEIETDVSPAPIADDTDTVIPILSILGGNSSDTDATDVEPEPATVQIEQINVVTDENETVTVSDINIDTEIIDENESDDADIISDMINDDAPVSNTEKTLEQLLESMTPLREDHDTDNDADAITSAEDDVTISDEDDTDATLAQLASEFAETEETIVVETKTETHGKIGKLKNILPFKKSKRDDGGIMGDLFGWAGIAANDEEFSMPGFFTTGTPRKQGA